MLYMLLALASLVITALSFWMYRSSGGGALYLVGMIVFLIATIGLGAMFFSGRINRTDDIHITE